MIQAVCWVLVHSLWQGVLLALAGGGVILATKRLEAAVRYRLLCGLAGMFLAGIGATFLYEWMMVSGGIGGQGGEGAPMNWLGSWCSAHAVQIVGVWFVITVVKSMRMAAGWKYIRRIRREGMMAPALRVDRVDELSRQLGIRRVVKLVESALIRVPVVIGQLRPIIYLPLGLINHLPASEIEAMLLHELAHIRRYDHVVNMVQQVAECLLFFNPGFLWISALIREERENCCDDMAIAHTQDRVEFVRALVRFKEHSIRGIVLAFPGNKRQLLHRVLRISKQENKTLNGKERLILLGGCMVLLCLLTARLGGADVQKMQAPVRGMEIAEVRQQVAGSVAAGPAEAGVQLVKAPSDVMVVIKQRQQVAQNMEWVQAQLDRLHHRPGKKKRKVAMDDGQAAQASVQVQQAEAREAAVQQEQAREGAVQQEQADYQQMLMERDADRNHEQANKDREQAARDREQAARDREQANRDREQAGRDRHQAELDRQQADRDRVQAENDRVNAEMARQKADRDRHTAKNN